MKRLYVFSGPCGSGKTTLSTAYAKRLIDDCESKQVYVIHGDDIHRNLLETPRRLGPDDPDFLYWPQVLQLIWSCMLSLADQALSRGLDVVLDYVVEDELPRLRALARQHDAQLYYIVLTAPEETLCQRLIRRGDPHLADRAVFLKHKLEQLPDNQGHLCSGTVDASALDMQRYILPASPAD